MAAKSKQSQRTLEIFLIVIVIALTALLHRTVGYKLIVLNLFYLPVVLAAFFLGRYRAGILALFSMMAASVVSVADLAGFSSYTSPVIIALSVTVWGAVLGLTALLVGTLSDDRSAKMLELHEAYVGVVEVLARYLQSANPKLKDRSVRVARLGEAVARYMRLAEKEIDDIRVAALLQDMEHIEITARVVRKAMDDLGEEEAHKAQHTFHGTDLVQSLGTVLTGAFPLVLNTNAPEFNETEKQSRLADIPMGGRIIQSVRAFDTLVNCSSRETGMRPQDAIQELRRDTEANHHPAVLHALEMVIDGNAGAEPSYKSVTRDNGPTLSLSV
jgi:hypothetical protein